MAKRKPKAEPLSEVPAAPKDLGKHGREYWQRLAPLLVEARILTPLHLEAFKVLCETWQIYREMQLKLNKLDDWTFTTDKGYCAELPEVRLRQTAIQTLARLWPKFGLTPEALAKLGKHGGAAGGRLPELEAFAAMKYSGPE